VTSFYIWIQAAHFSVNRFAQAISITCYIRKTDKNRSSETMCYAKPSPKITIKKTFTRKMAKCVYIQCTPWTSCLTCCRISVWSNYISRVLKKSSLIYWNNVKLNSVSRSKAVYFIYMPCVNINNIFLYIQ